MLTWNQQPEEPKKMFVWPWEEEKINAAEYMRALQGLNRFLKEVDIDQLYTLEDVSAAASLLGHDLRVIAMAKGTAVEIRSGFLAGVTNGSIDDIYQKYVLTMFINDQEVVMTADSEHVLVSEKSIIGFQRYRREILRVRLPTDRDIAIGEQPNVDEQGIYALDLREGGVKEYHPTREPDNTELQQEFTRVLKDVIGHVRELVEGLS